MSKRRAKGKRSRER